MPSVLPKVKRINCLASHGSSFGCEVRMRSMLQHGGFGTLGLCATLVAVMTMGVACGPLGAGASDSETQIVRGRKADGFVLKHTVGVSWSSAIDNSRPYCTATIISAEPPLVLTAAHCAQRTTPEDGSILQPGEPNFVHFGPGQLRRVTKSVPHPDWTETYADVAVLAFEGPLPSGFEPIRIADSEQVVEGALASEPRTADALTDADFVIAGWGLTSTQGQRPDEILSTQVRLWQLFQKGFGLGLLSFESTEGQGACYGDSGGPAFYEIDGQWQLVGVTHGSRSAFLRNLPRELQGNCDVGKSLYTSAANFKPWVLSVFPEAKLPGQVQPYVRWSGSSKASSFAEACRLGGALLWEQWVVVLNLMLAAGTSDCAQAEAFYESAVFDPQVSPDADALPSGWVGPLLALTSGSEARLDPELLPKAPFVRAVRVAGRLVVEPNDIDGFFDFMRQRLPGLQALLLRRDTHPPQVAEKLERAAQRYGIRIVFITF
jgi:hypothetical protein